MTYEIPQQLEYKEKIIFNLTFGQLLYATIFSPFVLAALFKLPHAMTYRVAIALVPSSLALVFMFTDFPQKIWDWIEWRGWKEFYLMDDKMKQYLQLKKVEKHVLQLEGRKVSILKVDPINFGIKDKQEKEIVIHTFQRFLNSLDFPVQIVIHTDAMNIDEYTSSMKERVDELVKKTGNKKYSRLYAGYTRHLHNTITQNSLLNRSFYLVVPEKSEVGLDIQLGVCEELLRNMGLRFTRLEDDDLTLELSSFFNNIYDDDDKKPLLDEELNEDNRLHYSVAPKCFLNYANEIQAGDKIVRTIAVRGYPRMVEEGFLDKIVTLNGDFDLAIHVEPYPIETMMVTLNKELQKQRADLWSMENKGIINPSLEIKYKDTRSVLESLQKGNEKLFNVSLYITCKGTTEEELDLLTKKAESELNALLMVSHKPTHLMHKALKSTLPFGTDDIGVKRNITTKALSAFFPFTSQFLQVDDTGIWLGLNKNNIPLIKDIFKLYNANGVVLASSGGGKSYFTKLTISRLLLNGTKVLVVDPQAEYTDLVNEFDGQLVTISRSSATVINPLDLMGHDYDEKKLTLMDLFPVMIGPTSDIQKAVLDRALTDVYKSKGITNDQRTWNKEPPKMEDLLARLKQMSKTATKVESETYRSLINRIEMYVTGVFSFLNRQTNINFDKRFVCFNIGDMPSQVKPVIMFLILDYVYMKMKKDIERKILVVDEAWSLLERAEDEGYIFKIVKTCRKFNMGLLLITQDVGDLLKNNAGKALLNNSEYTLLLRQKPAIIDQVEKTFKLSQKEKERLLSATAGEGVLIISNEHSEIKIVASPEEHKIITTNADERLEIEKAREPTIEYELPAQPAQEDKGFYKKSDLTEQDIRQLLDIGYIVSEHVGLFGGRREAYLLKPRYNESPEHFFTTKAIEEYLRTFTDKIWLYETTKPDIVFEAEGKKVGIEVETGLKLRKNNPRIEEKVKLLNEQYDDWFFVAIDWRDKEKYQKYGKTYVRKEVPDVLEKYFRSLGSNSSNTKSKKAENRHSEVQNVPGNKASTV